jgi:two-component system LytT family sensor kinase
MPTVEPRVLTPEQFLLTLLVRLAAIAVLATMLARFHRFRRILIFERRGWVDRLVFTLSLGVPLMVGVTSRVILKYDAADLTLEGAFLAGLLAGPYTGALVGLLAATPALIANEFIALPFAVGCGFAGGGLRALCPKEEIWQFTPFVVVDVRKHLWKTVRNLEPNWQLALLLATVALELMRQALGARFGADRLFYLGSPSPWMTLVVVLVTVAAVATPIKIWNSARIEHRLQEQAQLLLAAKIDALKSQINPQTSISSLIRSQPDTARTLILKLSALLRRLLRSHQHFVTLREELESIDEYLDIEVIRFGPKLRVRKEISPDTLDVVVPSMILQPLVENSIKHGFARKVGPGAITLRSWRENGRAVVEVEDDGLGFMLERLDQPMSSGIGLANVRERLTVIYGDQYQLKLTSEPGRGTSARIEIPELTAVQQITA